MVHPFSTVSVVVVVVIVVVVVVIVVVLCVKIGIVLDNLTIFFNCMF